MRGSPWLILDEFNLPGPDNVNMLFAETLFRQVAERKLKFNILFIAQNEQMVTDLLALNSWQNIAPLPGLTSPDSVTVLSAEDVPPKFHWVKMPWTRRQLSLVVYLNFPKIKEDKENIEQEDGVDVFKPLTGSESPTGACKLAAEREGEIRRGPGASSSKHDSWIKQSQAAIDYM